VSTPATARREATERTVGVMKAFRLMGAIMEIRSLPHSIRTVVFKPS
jgi:hypothetical protein